MTKTLYVFRQDISISLGLYFLYLFLFSNFVIIIQKLHTMNKVLYIGLFFLIMMCSCFSEDEKHLNILMKELNITASDGLLPDVVIVIPANGCASCIEDALNHIRESNDTAFVLACDSEKEFYLLSEGKKASLFNNLFLDTGKISTGTGMVQSYPMVYFLKDGKFVSKEAYKPVKKKALYEDLTTVMVETHEIDLGKIKMESCSIDSVKILNEGLKDLQIKEIQTSCECVEAKVSKQIASSMETVWVSIAFRPEDKGVFERYVYVYANTKESPIEISIKGCVE